VCAYSGRGKAYRRALNQGADHDTAARLSLGAVRVARNCADCGTTVPWDGRGQCAHRCPMCMPVHQRAVQRAKHSGRTVEEEKQREREGGRCTVCDAPLPSGLHYKRCEPCRSAYQRSYHRAWRYGTTVADEMAREAGRRCRICGDAPSHLNKQWCDTCVTTGRVKVYRRAVKHYHLDHDTAVLVSAAVECVVCGRLLDRTLTSDTGSDSAAHIDHCHATNTVRGVLCGPCNRSMGYMDDDPARLRAAASYLEGQLAGTQSDDGDTRAVALSAASVPLTDGLRHAFGESPGRIRSASRPV
jgi:Recombination endonuclease VII